LWKLAPTDDEQMSIKNPTEINEIFDDITYEKGFI